MSLKMKLAVAGVALALSAPVAVAQDAQASIKAFEDVAANQEKLSTYCAMTKKIDEVGDDEAKAKAAEEEVDGYLNTLGPEFEAAWAGGDETDENSAELEKVEAALADLDSKCGG
jgi:inhibitor of KinA sporulation pathway (predicted exonuclease)